MQNVPRRLVRARAKTNRSHDRKPNYLSVMNYLLWFSQIQIWLTVGVAHFPSILAASRVIGIARVHNVCLPHSSGVAA
jgi:hypothetical protein